MQCDVCGRINGHSRGCPEYEDEKIKPSHYCSICNSGILNEEEYIENDCGDYAHWECVDGKFSMADWLKIRIMKE